MLRRGVLAAIAIAGCAPEARAPEAPPPAWVYAPPPTLWQSVPSRGRIGRSQAPQVVDALGLVAPTADPKLNVPLSRPTPWTIPGDGAPRAAIGGNEAHPRHEGGRTEGQQVRAAVELVDLDAGRVLWRDTKHCAAPVVGVTSESIVCADARGTRALALDGKPKWQLEQAFIAVTDERVLLGSGPEAIVLDGASGDELARMKLPANLVAEELHAACGDAGRELFASQAERLVRVGEAKGGTGVTWTIPIGSLVELDACTGDTVLALVDNAPSTTAPTTTLDAPPPRAMPGAALPGAAPKAPTPPRTSLPPPSPTTSEAPTPVAAPGRSLLAIDRKTGQIVGRADGANSFWPARDGSDFVEVAFSHGLYRYNRALAATATAVDPRHYGELIASRGAFRLVRTSPLTAVLLDARGVRAYLPFASAGAVLGSRSILAASWHGATSETVRRIAIPPPYDRALRLPSRAPGVAVPAELRDLPAPTPLDPASAIAKPDTAKHAVAAITLDPTTPHLIYAASLEAAADDDKTASLASVDLAKREWRWQRPDGCGPGSPIALAVTSEVVLCAARTTNPTTPTLATVRATSIDGVAKWEWEGAYVDAIAAAGDIVLVFDANTLHVLDARTGRARERIVSDDGAPVRAALVTMSTPIANDDAAQLDRPRDEVFARRMQPPTIAMSAKSNRTPPNPTTNPGIAMSAKSNRTAPDPSVNPMSATPDGPRVHGADEPKSTSGTIATTYLVTYERGRVVVRVPVLEGIAIWAYDVDGVVKSIAAVQGGVHVVLEDGDAYHVDLETAESVAVPALNLAWTPLGDLVGGATAGGPIPGTKPVALPPPPVVKDRFGRVIDCVRFELHPACRAAAAAAAAGRPQPVVRVPRPPGRPRFGGRNPAPPGDPEGPRLWTPIPVPPPLGRSWQLALHESATATFRARNDYGLFGEVVLSTVRGPAGAPLVVASGEGLRAVLVLDPRTGDPVRRVELPEDAASGLVFGTVVDGSPIAGAVLAAPLRVVVF